MRTNSLAFRLIAASAVWSVIVLAITGVILSSLFRAAIERNFDEQLEILLDGVIANVELSREGQLSEAGDLGVVRFNLPFSGWYWQVTQKDDASVEGLASLSLLDQKISLPSAKKSTLLTGELQRGYVNGPEDKRIRVIEHQTRLVGSEKIYSFMVAGNPDQLELQIADFNKALAIALSVVAVGLLIAVLLQVRYGLRPLRMFRRALARIRSGDAERISEQYPEEIEPIANELNALLQSNQEIIERSRTHVGNLAHALKTPLSVIMNEAKSSRSPFAKKAADQSHIMRDQINLYLDRARMAARARVIGSITEIEPIVDGLVRTLERINLDRGIEATINCPNPANFQGERQDLEELLGNLLDNAFKWAKSRVDVTVEILPGAAADAQSQCVIHVDDDGPGLPKERRADALKRGKRLDESKPGSGLGLSIVTELAALYNGGIELATSPTGGLRVTARLPSA